LALFNAAGYLEIAVYRSSIETGGASTLLGLYYGNPIIIDFIDDEKPEFTQLT
jgi:hypothetical protein